jgi:hypothetical protein
MTQMRRVRDVAYMFRGVKLLLNALADEDRELLASYIVSNDQNFLKSAARTALDTCGDPARRRAA